MPDGASTALLKIHQEAIASLNQWEWLSTSERLSPVVLQAEYRSRDFVAGWRLKAEFASETKRLDILATAQFPFSLPRIALVDRPPFLTWPHVESDGVLCLVSDSSTADHRAYVGQVKTLLGEAYNLVTASIGNTNQEDFRHEFYSYWSHEAGEQHIPFLSLITPEGPSRRIEVWRGSTQLIFGETQGSVSEWMNNRFSEAAKSRETDAAALIWFREPLLPSEYPKTASDVWALAAEKAPDALDILRELASKGPKRIVALLGATGEHGPCFGGVTIPAPELLSKGFRPGHTPAALTVNRYWGSTKNVTRAEVARADAAWVHGRGKDPRQVQLREKTIIVIGAGSLGAPVARQLAMAGVGKLNIIDPDKIRYANVGRHPLGAQHVGEMKAEALATELLKSYPHSAFEFRNSDWRKIDLAELELLQGASLIISMTGDWGAEDALNEWHLNRPAMPIIYGWIEAHACAGHAVFVNPTSGCLACGFNEVGKPHLRVTDWPEAKLEQEPACGALYQPYGPAELGYSVNLVSELALDVLLGLEADSCHRIWACRTSFLQSNGGQWTKGWLELEDSRAQGGCIATRPWPRHPNCASCARAV